MFDLPPEIEAEMVSEKMFYILKAEPHPSSCHCFHCADLIRSVDEDVFAECNELTDEQRSLAWCPMPPHEPTNGNLNSGLGGVFSDDSLRARWIRARFRYRREQKRRGER